MTKKAKNRVTRLLFITGGSFSVAFAVLGIFLPLLPTTPFLLLAAYFFSKSSDRFHNWLINHNWFGNYIKNYQAGKGIPLHSKITAILSMWLLLLSATIWGTELLIVRIIIIFTGIAVTTHLLRMPTFRETKIYRIDTNEE